MSGVLHRMYYNMTKKSVTGSKATSNVFELSRFLFVLGQTALNTLVFTEALAALAKKVAPKNVVEPSNKNSAATAVDAMEEEMGCAAAADADHDKVNKSFLNNF